MAAPSKSSQTAKNVVLALLALWSVVSLIIIVVWATSPDLKSSARCRAELLEVTEKLEGAKVVYGKNKVALEELLEKTGEQRDALRADLLVMGGRLDATNATLEECRLENVSFFTPPDTMGVSHTCGKCSMEAKLCQCAD